MEYFENLAYGGRENKRKILRERGIEGLQKAFDPLTGEPLHEKEVFDDSRMFEEGLRVRVVWTNRANNDVYEDGPKKGEYVDGEA